LLLSGDSLLVFYPGSTINIASCAAMQSQAVIYEGADSSLIGKNATLINFSQTCTSQIDYKKKLGNGVCGNFHTRDSKLIVTFLDLSSCGESGSNPTPIPTLTPTPTPMPHTNPNPSSSSQVTSTVISTTSGTVVQDQKIQGPSNTNMLIAVTVTIVVVIALAIISAVVLSKVPKFRQTIFNSDNHQPSVDITVLQSGTTSAD
jgi:hypothetical protein